MADFTFVHAADLHLDAPIGGLGRELVESPGPERQELVRLLGEATFIALSRLTDLCIDCDADALLLAGDLFNSGQGSLRARLALREAFTRLREKNIAVYIAHGNHDPLRGENAAVPWPDNVTVFGRRPETASVSSSKERQFPVFIHGVSHAGPHEEKNLAALLSRKQDGGASLQLGLVHCAVTTLAGSHKLYAPCAVADLKAAKLDYFALGHVHGLKVLDGEGKTASPMQAFQPLAAYPGSLQGLHVNESGPHGCLIGRFEAGRRLELRFVPLAPVQWEQPRIGPCPELEAADDINTLEKIILDRLEGLSPVRTRDGTPEAGAGAARFADGLSLSVPPKAVLARLVLSGPTALDATLRQPGAAADLRDYLNAGLEYNGVFIRDLALATRPRFDPEALLNRRDLAGEVMRALRDLRENPEALKEFALPALSPLFEQPSVRKALDGDAALQDDELAELAEEAALLCVEMLGGHELFDETDADGSESEDRA